MLHHVSLPVADLERASALYDAALTVLGYRRVVSFDDFIGCGIEDGKDKFAIARVTKAVAAGPGFHLALEAPSRNAVDEFYASAIRLGATDNGSPGLRPDYGPNYYAAFILDLDRHRIEVVSNDS